MDNIDQTTFFIPEGGGGSAPARVTLLDGASPPVEIDLSGFGKDIVTFGRDQSNDIVLQSMLVSRRHGMFRCFNGRWAVEDAGSRNGLTHNGEAFRGKLLEDGDAIRIDDKGEVTARSVLMVFSYYGGAEWLNFPLTTAEATIGRGETCDIRLDHISVSRFHAKIMARGDEFYLTDTNSTNGVSVNGHKVTGWVKLKEKDLIVITNSKLIYTNRSITFCCFKSGISVEAENIFKEVGKNKVICSGVSLHIKPGELVAIVGGSGAGKSTVMNCLSGYSQPTSGGVTVNGVDLYANYHAMKSIIGYVPQSDIVYDNLTVFDMLRYAARLRLPADVSESECMRRIDAVIETMDIANRKDTLIRRLSGGQRKRASIAVELLSDPNLFFLDEPASGLDPGTERNLMKTLRNMTMAGKTVVFVTHSTLNLQLCDKIVFMGAGGHLCFCGSYSEAQAFFSVDDIVDVYNLLNDEPLKWRDLYHSMSKPAASGAAPLVLKSSAANRERSKQIKVLCKRHLHLVVNDRVRLLLILLQAPLLALLISFVADGNQYDDYRITKSLLFALACSAFWLGVLNSIQEVCKERHVLIREYMTGLRLDTYIISKIIVMSIICAVQSALLTAMFSLAVGLPYYGVITSPLIEILITTFLSALAASVMGLVVSSLFRNADRAMTVAPLLLMPQLLFSGLIFELSGVTQVISVIAVCRWSMQGYGTTSNLNAMDTITNEGFRVQRDAEAFFTYTRSHQVATWLVLIVFIAVCSFLAWVVLRNINSERGRRQ